MSPDAAMNLTGTVQKRGKEKYLTDKENPDIIAPAVKELYFTGELI